MPKLPILKNANKEVKPKKSQSLAKEKSYEPKFDKRSMSCNATPTILTGSSFGKKLLMNNQRANKFLENGVEKDWMNNNMIPQLDVTKILSQDSPILGDREHKQINPLYKSANRSGIGKGLGRETSMQPRRINSEMCNLSNRQNSQRNPL